MTTLAVLLEGSLATAIAGVKAGLLAAVLMAIFASVLGWLVGNVARREGTSSTVTSRFHGLGIQGSGIASAVIAFGIISALGLENALLYNGTLFALNWDDTWATRIGIYGGMTLAWILLTLFGTVAVRRISSILVLAFLCLLAFMIWKAGFGSGVPITTTLSHGPLIPGLGSMNERFQAALVILAAPAVLLSVIGADYARWARSSKDVGIMAVCGSVMMEIVVVIIGAVIIFGSTGIVGDYLSQQGRATPEAAHEAASRLAENNTGAYFIILASTIGFLFMYAAQVKAQV
ncbi:MAG: hypothetical protein J2P19_10900, partial [Pseudonocardia sp.]|nr:hypothetical protein [Pseudonocardia sp.]